MIDVFKGLESEIVNLHEIPPRKGSYGSFKFRHEEVNKLVEELGFKLYSHQVEALKLLYSGKNVVVSTPTASGKSEIFRLFIFDEFLEDSSSTFLLIYPTRALINNQLEKFERENEIFSKITGRKVGNSILTGDVELSERRRIRREKPNVIFTTPDMLHYNLLPRWLDYKWLFKNLKLLVVDELHIYRGVFGSNVAYVFRRLFLRLRRLKVNPRILALSATLKNPKDFAEKFFGFEFEEVTEAGNPSPKRYIIMFEPTRFSGEQLIRQIVERLVENDVKTLVFFDSRKGTERIMRMFLGSKVFNLITTYKGTLTKLERWRIESDFREGKLKALLTTNALELGIDVGDLDAVINYGIPSDGLFSLIQRFGRAGRDPNRVAINGIVLRRNGLDYYYKEHFEELVEGIEKGLVEGIPVNLDNERIAKKHLHYLLSELGVVDVNEIPEHWRIALRPLKEEGIVEEYLNPLTNKVEIRIKKPAIYSSIRSTSDESFFLVKDEGWIRSSLVRKSGGELLRFVNYLKARGFIIEEVDEVEFYRSLLPGMVYPSRGRLFMVIDKINVDKFHFVFAQEIPMNEDVETNVHKSENVEVLKVQDEKSFGPIKVYFGRLKVTHEYLGYAVKGKDVERHVERLERLRDAGILRGEIEFNVTMFEEWWKFARVSFYSPYKREFETEGVWLVFPRSIDEVPAEEFRHFFSIASEYNYELAMFLFNKLSRGVLFPSLLGATTHYIRAVIRKVAKEEGLDENFVFAVKKMVDSKDGVKSGLHAIEHNLIKIAPVVTHVDSRELGGYSYDDFNGLPTIFIYDGNEGGSGIARLIYENIEKLIVRSREHIAKCPCKDGCPACVYSPKCGTFNEFLDKWMAIKIWDKVLNQKV
ncbi:DEAD/DEAH box helicase [Pyrococcus abyssi]|uniref:DEAD/DEAH box RNA helicase n=1 Tax=Pyrococcus abyssi (strain GE5 / Orsay) TaxID=272844 RepID=Q9V019_PYRAB|nr:DEAD/DEAH box helicase [Pyrococcus abyssi]CAB49887.1 DEAD/DEAH box RNA helicase [Pyrococcus abyssi GE5]CCE70385.1 TPA: DNA helicases [Pyrococcus abyssi GE5]